MQTKLKILYNVLRILCWATVIVLSLTAGWTCLYVHILVLQITFSPYEERGLPSGDNCEYETS